MFSLLFPPKCKFCRQLLKNEETDLCRQCRTDAPEFLRAKRNIPFVAHWTAVWYYRDNVSRSIRRFKFYNARSYAQLYGKVLAQKLQQDERFSFDILSWVPVSPLRRLRRGYDQAQLLAEVAGKELGIKPVRTLTKHHHTPPQSQLKSISKRRANVLNVYRVSNPEMIRDKRILLLDDVVTTGATCSECAKTLQMAGAKQVLFAALAAASQDKLSR